MKNTILSVIHFIFRIRPFEWMLLPFVRSRYTNERITSLIPPHHSYKNPASRVAKQGSLRLFANLYDYNDWKAYWNLKETERENLYALAESAKTVIDIGSNNGWVLMNMAEIIAPNNGFIYGFEPHPITYKRCIKNIKASGIKNCEVFNMGCGETEAEFSMTIVKESNSGQNRIVETNGTIHNHSVKVKVIKPDDKFAGLERIDLIKIDVEGFELHVLKGTQKLLQKHKPVLFIEIDDELLRANNTTPLEVMDFLSTNYNYTIKNALNRQHVDRSACFDNSHMDIICVHENGSQGNTH